MQHDGTRVTFSAEQVADGVISGTSDVVGACSAKLDAIDALLLGRSIETEASTLVYGRWILQDAEEPKFAQAAGESDGTESPLVGKPAPDFELALLDGKTFRLSECKGQVVILDFWATWCGPCLQTMPQVERVAGEFRDRGVRLVAVNLQEASKDITALLTRQQLKLTVALDRDGVVAEKYNATAIPQTVVIHRDGTVAHLFVGGGPDFEAPCARPSTSCRTWRRPSEQRRGNTVTKSAGLASPLTKGGSRGVPACPRTREEPPPAPPW